MLALGLLIGGLIMWIMPKEISIARDPYYAVANV